MNTTFLYFFFTSAVAHFQNSDGTISAMSQRNPSTPFPAQKSRMSRIFFHVSGIGEKWVDTPPASQ